MNGKKTIVIGIEKIHIEIVIVKSQKLTRKTFHYYKVNMIHIYPVLIYSSNLTKRPPWHSYPCVSGWRFECYQLNQILPKTYGRAWLPQIYGIFKVMKYVKLSFITNCVGWKLITKIWIYYWYIFILTWANRKAIGYVLYGHSKIPVPCFVSSLLSCDGSRCISYTA